MGPIISNMFINIIMQLEWLHVLNHGNLILNQNRYVIFDWKQTSFKIT